MSSQNQRAGDVAELCDNCGHRQPHAVTIELLTESDDDENAAFSREPYRITECRVCGETSKTRMNNA